MNNRRSMLNSLLTIGAASAVVYGINRGVRNGTFQRLPQTLSKAVKNLQNMTKPLQNITSNQTVQQMTTSLPTGGNDIKQQTENNNNLINPS